MKNKKNCYIALAQTNTYHDIQMKAGCTAGSAKARMNQHQSSYYTIEGGQNYSPYLGENNLVYEKSFVDSTSREQVLINSVREVARILTEAGKRVLLHHAPVEDSRSNPAPWITKIDSRIVKMLIQKVLGNWDKEAIRAEEELANTQANIAKRKESVPNMQKAITEKRKVANQQKQILSEALAKVA